MPYRNHGRIYASVERVVRRVCPVKDLRVEADVRIGTYDEILDRQVAQIDHKSAAPGIAALKE